MDIYNLDLSELFPPEFIDEYQERRRALYDELTILNTYIYLLGKLIDFPFGLFLIQPDTLFFNYAFDSFLKLTILTIKKVYSDQGTDSLTLNYFKSLIFRNLNSSYKEAFKRKIKNSQPSREIRNLIEKSDVVRDKMIAHLLFNLSGNAVKISRKEFEDQKRIAFTELQDITKALTDYFYSLNLGSIDSRLIIPIQYHCDNKDDPIRYHEPDIDKILNGIAQHSDILNMPERDPEGWQYRRKRFSPQDLETINEYRIKFGLFPA